MIGLAVLAGAAIYIGISWAIVRTVKTTWPRLILIASLVLVPFWDLPIGYLSYLHHCQAESGLHIERTIRPQREVFFDSMPSVSANELIASGLTAVEIARPNGRGIARHEATGQGKLTTQIIDRPRSQIRVSYIRNEELPWHVLREDKIVRSTSDNALLARYSAFAWRGGWLQVSLSPLLGTGPSCAGNVKDPIVTLLVNGGAPSS
ncbi:MAG TPA: hypothetical protein VFB08_19090 [Burkholderiales bacterium]|nr:hypothetical protein [Burkholderiales bacterium]